MLRKLELHNVGPAARLSLDPVAPRFNLLTGDNGLGKSFLLDVAWWALTRTWVDQQAMPFSPAASIGFAFDTESGRIIESESAWQPEAQTWRRTPGRPPNPGLVMYARVDGSFSVWDPVRNYRLYTRPDGGENESPHAYHFSPAQALDGLVRDVPMPDGKPRRETLCLGLINETREWQNANDPRFDLLSRLLAALGPGGLPLVPGKLIRPSLDDVRGVPTIRMPYGQDVPITQAPAGIRRVWTLAYLLAWAMSEHERAAPMLGREPSRQVIMLVDEIETHLHPRWQRTVLTSMLAALESWRPVDVQLLVTTHSPFVLTSVEPHFEPERDALWKLDLVGDRVELERDAWHKRGDALMWLASDVFDETSPYSPEADAAMAAAKQLMSSPSTTPEQADAVRASLREVLADTDPFWLHWRVWRRSRGWAA